MSDSPADAPDDLVLSIRNVHAKPGTEPGELAVEIDTTRGAIPAVLHPCEGKTGCAIFIGGARGGIREGPAGGVYLRLSRELVARGVTSLRLGYREAGEFNECVLDVLTACSFLQGIGADRAIIVGHSFGGAVAIKVGEVTPLACAVASLSPQLYGTANVAVLGKPLLLIHGSDDTVLLPLVSELIFERALDPKRLVILEGGGHSLREVAEDVHALLSEFITDTAGDPPEPDP